MDIIRENLPYLVEKTGNLPVLANNLFADKVISKYENELINSKATLTEKISELYRIVMSKPDKPLGKLIECLRKSGNGYIAEVLEGQPIGGKSLNKMSNPIWFDIRPKDSNFRGREIELEKLKKSWQKSQQHKNTLKMFLISGVGGVGKSELCKVFMTDLYLSQEVSRIWMNAETDSTLLQSVKRLATRVEINLLDQMGKEKEDGVIISNVFDLLRMMKVVMVFDNLEQITAVFKIVLEEIQRLQLLDPSEMMPFVIITTRFQVLQEEFPENTKLIELEALSPNDAIAYLTKALKIQGHDYDTVLEVLARRLQYFPLDLKQAAGFIHSHNSASSKLGRSTFGVKEYLDLFDTKRKDLLDFHEVSYRKLNRRSETTYINWKVVKEDLLTNSEIGLICVVLMSIVSFFSPDDISVSALKDVMEYLMNTPDASNTSSFLNIDNCNQGNETFEISMMEAAIILCSEYSLFSLKDGGIYIHRLAQEVIRVELANAGGVDKRVISVLVYCFQDKLMSKSIPQNCIHHTIQLWDHVTKDPQLVEEHNDFPQWIFDQLYSDIKYSESASFALKAIEVLRSVVGEIEVTLKLMLNRCVVLADNGKYDEALIRYREVYEKMKMLLGAEHQWTLESEYGIGETLYYQKKHEEALDVLESTVIIQEQVLGRENTYTLVTKDMIATAFKQQGKYNEAMLIYREIDSIRQRVLGEDHRETLAGKNNMALVLLCQEKYEEALQIFHELNDIKERVLVCDHPDTLMGKVCIAVALHKKGENSNALSLLLDVYEKNTRVLGVDHPETVNTKGWIDTIDATVNKIE